MRYAPRKIFLLEDGEYIEIAYVDLMKIIEQQEDKRYFLPLHGMLMEVSEEEYHRFYKDKRRQKYIEEESRNNGEISYDVLANDKFNGEDILVDLELNVEELVEKNLAREQLYEALRMLNSEERQLIQAMFFEGKTEREYAKQQGIYPNAVHKKKKRILEKLRHLMNGKVSK